MLLNTFLSVKASIRCDAKLENHISNFVEIEWRVLYWRNDIIDLYTLNIHLIAISVRLPKNNDNANSIVKIEFEIISFVSYSSNGNISNAVNDVVIITVTLMKRSNNYIHEDSDSIISELIIYQLDLIFNQKIILAILKTF